MSYDLSPPNFPHSLKPAGDILGTTTSQKILGLEKSTLPISSFMKSLAGVLLHNYSCLCYLDWLYLL